MGDIVPSSSSSLRPELDIWVYGLTVFGNCGVDELPAADGGSNVEAVVWPWMIDDEAADG